MASNRPLQKTVRQHEHRSQLSYLKASLGQNIPRAVPYGHGNNNNYGEAIPSAIRNNTWFYTSSANCNYNNDVNNVGIQGSLYYWFAARNSRIIALAGRHVPTDVEWKQLETYLG